MNLIKSNIFSRIRSAGYLILTTTALSANVTAAGEVPARTFFQANKIIKMQYPEASDITASAYTTDSINGIVGEVLNASTVIEFTEQGTRKSVVMLPDGQHLLVGTIIKPETKAIRSHIRNPIADHPKLALDKIEQDHRSNTKVGTNAAGINMDKYRLTNDDLDPVFDGAYKNTDDFFERIEEHSAIQTGNGPLHVYVFTDPNCPNCQHEYISSAKHKADITFHWIPIYALTNKPTIKQVAISQSSSETNKKNFDSLMTNPASANLLSFDTTPEVALQLQQHQKLFYNLKDKRTPVTLYKNSEGKITKINGYNPRLFEYIIND